MNDPNTIPTNQLPDQSRLPNDAKLYPEPLKAEPKTHSTKKRLLLAVIATLLLAIVGWGIFWMVSGSQSESKSGQFYQGKIRIALTPWAGNLGYYIADSKGYFKQAGLDVEIKSYDSLVASEQDYLGGKVQGLSNLNIAVLGKSQTGFDQKIVLVNDYSSGADGIIARAPITNVGQLKGQKIAYERISLEDVFLLYALQQYGLTLADVTPIDLGSSATAQAFADGQVSAAVTYEPNMSAALQKGGSVIFSSKDAPGLISDVLTFRTAFINQYPDSLTSFIQAYFRGLQFWKDHPDEGNAIVAKAMGDTPGSVAKQLEGITMLDVRNNNTAFTFAAGLNSLYGNLRQLASLTSSDSQSNSVRLDTDKLIEPRFIEALSQ